MVENTRDEYWTELRSTAAEILADLEITTQEEYEAKREEVDCRIHEEIDGSGWIIYTNNHLDVLKFSNNEDAAEDMGIELDSRTGWRGVVQAAAFYAMKQDLTDEVLSAKNDLPEKKE